jgi:hypothetical protein
VLGFVDDRRPVPARVRFAGHVLAGALVLALLSPLPPVPVLGMDRRTYDRALATRFLGRDGTLLLAGGGTIGAQIGGQDYSEVIFFKDKSALDRFKRGEAAFQAGGSAVAAGAGASAAVDYKDGVAVFAFGAEGLMLEGVIGGQTFSFDPIK